MTLNEINELRKAGKIEEAYKEARQLYEQESSDESRLALALCSKAIGERCAKGGDIKGLTERINEIGQLQLEEIGEAELNNRLAWDVRSLVLTLREQKKFDSAALDSLFDALTGVAFLKPHRYYSILLDALLRVRDEHDEPWDAFAEVLDWWGPEFFLPEDFQKVRMNNGAMMTSLAERAYTQAVKSILLAAERGISSEEDLERLVGELDNLLVTHPEFQYTLYHKTLLLKALGRMEDAVNSAREFVKANQQYFWAWARLGEILEESEIQLACYCRAMLCKASPEYLVKVRRKLAELMYEVGEYSAAKHELEEVKRIHGARGWRLPERVEELTSMPWYSETEAAESNIGFYHSHAGLTRDFLFGGVPEVAILVSKYNPQKQTVTFVTEDHKRGFFSTKRLTNRFADNQIYRVRFAEEPDGKTASRVMTISPVEDPTPYDGKLYRTERAEINIRPGQTFTFVDGIYVDGSLIRGVPAGTTADITAVSYYNIKKGDWGWRAVSVVPEYDY